MNAATTNTFPRSIARLGARPMGAFVAAAALLCAGYFGAACSPVKSPPPVAETEGSAHAMSAAAGTAPGIVAATGAATVGVTGAGTVAAPGTNGARAVRVVSLMPNLTELVYALDAGDRLVGRSEHCNYPAQVSAVRSVGSGFAPNLEAIVALSPSVVLASGSQSRLGALPTLAQFGIASTVVADEHLADVERAVYDVAAAVGSDRAPALWAHVAAQLAEAAALGAAHGATHGAPRVAVVLQRQPIYVAGAHTLLGELVAKVGGKNVFDGAYTMVDAESFLAAGAEVIVDVSPEAAADWPLFAALPAVRDGRICRPDADVVSRPGPRVGQAALTLAACLAPRRELPPPAQEPDQREQPAQPGIDAPAVDR